MSCINRLNLRDVRGPSRWRGGTGVWNVWLRLVLRADQADFPRDSAARLWHRQASPPYESPARHILDYILISNIGFLQDSLGYYFIGKPQEFLVSQRKQLAYLKESSKTLYRHNNVIIIKSNISTKKLPYQRRKITFYQDLHIFQCKLTISYNKYLVTKNDWVYIRL